jgi:hypothetical protein
MDCSTESVAHSERVLRRVFHAVALMLTFAAGRGADAGPAPPPLPPDGPPLDGRYAQVTVEPARTSIYIGIVSLTVPPAMRQGSVYAADYAVKVFPFFYSEHGHLAIGFSNESLRQLRRGETVTFTGHASNSAGAPRRLEGNAIPEGPNATRGKIKVRVWVGRIELTFNTVYRFTGAE